MAGPGGTCQEVEEVMGFIIVLICAAIGFAAFRYAVKDQLGTGTKPGTILLIAASIGIIVFFIALDVAGMFF